MMVQHSWIANIVGTDFYLPCVTPYERMVRVIYLHSSYRLIIKNIYSSFSMYFFERTLVRVLPTHTVSGPAGGGSGGDASPPPDTATSIQAPFGCPANPAHTPTPTHTTLLVPSKHRAAAIQAQFGCPANPVLVVHFGTHTPTPTHTTTLVVAYKHPSAALRTQRWWCMRWNVCASAVRSCSCGTTNTTYGKNISIRCALGCEK